MDLSGSEYFECSGEQCVCARGAGMDCAGVGCLVWAGLLRIYICE